MWNDLPSSSLNASPTKGPDGEQGSVKGASLWARSRALLLTSVGAGRYRLTPSRSSCTPLFLNALPMNTGYEQASKGAIHQCLDMPSSPPIKYIRTFQSVKSPLLSNQDKMLDLTHMWHKVKRGVAPMHAARTWNLSASVDLRTAACSTSADTGASARNRSATSSSTSDSRSTSSERRASTSALRASGTGISTTFAYAVVFFR